MADLDNELLSDVLLRLEELADVAGNTPFERLVELDADLRFKFDCDPVLAESAQRRFAALQALERCLQPPDQTLKRPPNIPGYELIEEIGRGGMGVVYRARQSTIARTVAIKLLLAGQLASERLRQRFLQEATTIGRLQHPHIVQVYESDHVNGQAYLVLEYVGGGNLAEACGSTAARAVCRGIGNKNRSGGTIRP